MSNTKDNLQEALETTRFGIEIEMTGITRNKAAKILAECFGTNVITGGHLDEHKVHDQTGRPWKIVSDSSIHPQRRANRVRERATKSYQVELVSPVLTYRADIEMLQEIVRTLRKADAFTNESCGIHIHLDGADHTPRSLRNFINIIASKDDLLYDALRIPQQRQRWCKKMNAQLVERIKRERPQTASRLEDIWYDTCGGDRRSHYSVSRYQFLNLHSYFQSGGNHTVELRGFNAGDDNQHLHAGLIRSYIVLAIALNQQALDQRCASAKPNQMENRTFAMRTYLNRIGLIGSEFANCRQHLTRHLTGNAAWRYGVAA